MNSRQIGGQSYTLIYDQENRMTQVTGAATANFTYDGDGQRVLSTQGGVTTVFIGNYYEWCQYSYVNVPVIFGNTAPGIFGNDVPL